MTSVNNSLGTASDQLLKLTSPSTRPSGFTGRELRREAARNAKAAAKANASARKGFG